MNNDEIKNPINNSPETQQQGSKIIESEPIHTVNVMPKEEPQAITTAIPAPETTTPTQEDSHETSISAIHTLEGDLFAAMKDDDYGNNVVKIVTNPTSNTNARFMKSDGGTETMKSDKKEAMKKYIKYIVIGTVVLIGVGVAAILSIHEKPTVVDNGGVATTTATSTRIIKVTSIINPEVYKKLSIANLDKNAVVRAINDTKVQLRDSKIAIHANVGLTLDVDVKTLFSKLRYTGPDSLLRSLADDYAFGLYVDKERMFEPYILLRINSYDLAFAGILEWETFIPGDLKDIFAKERLIATTTVNTTEAAIISTTTLTQQKIAPTVATTKTMAEKKFTDQVIKNIDTRMYVDTNANLTLIYGFINKDYLLITGGADSFIDIRNKLLTKNILR